MKPVCLTIAGSDSGGGAGIQADIKAMQANGAYAASVITAVTAQNTVAVNSVLEMPRDLIEAQLDTVCTDLDVRATKTGMLSSSQIISVVAAGIRRHDLHPLVVDPVMISKSGFALLADQAVDALVGELLPLADLVTPNVHEAERLTGSSISNLTDAKRAARRIHELGPKAVLVKGGHLDTEREAVDVLFDGASFELVRAERLDARNTHGTGCTYSSAIAARMALGDDVRAAVLSAKRYVTEAIRHGLAIGAGTGPTDHFYFLSEMTGGSDTKV